MAIEPLGSIMTMQAQPIQHAQTQQVQRQEVVNTEVNPVQKPEQNIDPSIMTVANTGETPEKNAYNSDGENGYSEENTKQQNEKIKKAVEQMNKNMSNSEAVFGIHEATNRVTIKIVDKDTKKVIKELPPEKTLDMIAKVWEMAGILVDERR